MHDCHLHSRGINMPRQVNRRPRPTEPLPSEAEDGKERHDETDSSRRRHAKKYPTRQRPPGDPPPMSMTSSPRREIEYIRDEPSAHKSLGAKRLLAEYDACVPLQEQCDGALTCSNSVEGRNGRGKSVRSQTDSGLYARTSSDGELRFHQRLRHSGRWIPAEYRVFKKLPWTGFWTCCGDKSSFTTHCPDFDARMHQAERTHEREKAECIARSRKKVASEFRSRWESCEPAATISRETAVEQGHLSDPPQIQYRVSRPFLRQKWMNRMATTAGAYIKANGGSGGCQDQRLVVQRDHVRSVVQVALSEARVNAFVIISALEGLLAVAGLGSKCATRSAGIGSDARRISTSMVHDTSAVPPAISDPEEITGKPCSPGRTEKSAKAPSAGCKRGNLKILHQVPERNSFVSSSAENAASAHSEMGATMVSDYCTGADLCVRLGALPAVLGGLNQHTGHKQIELLAISLLYAFATDLSACKALRGNHGVAAACVKRMFPMPLICDAASSRGGGHTTVDVSHAHRDATKCTDDALSTSHHRDDDVEAMVADLSGSTSSGPSTQERKELPMVLPRSELVCILSVALRSSPECQRIVLQEKGVEAMLSTIRRTRVGSRSAESARLTEACLNVLEYLGGLKQGRRRLVAEDAVETTVSVIENFRSHHGILAAAMALLLLLSATALGRSRILKVEGLRVVFQAMQRLIGNEAVQVQGAEMLQLLINEEPQARREFNAIKGGWQWLCQGTSGGNELIRYALGEKSIAGWTVCEAERLTTREALATVDMAAAEWTPFRLAAFMGTIRRHQIPQVGNLAYHHYFKVVSEAGLLPRTNEDVQQWRDRVIRYEEERRIRVNSITRRRMARDNGESAHAMSIASASSSLSASQSLGIDFVLGGKSHAP